MGTAAAEELVAEDGEASRNSPRRELDEAWGRIARDASSLSGNGNAPGVAGFVAEKFGLGHQRLLVRELEHSRVRCCKGGTNIQEARTR